MKPLTIAITLLALACANHPSVAQTEESNRSSSRESTISLTFPGGTAAEYLETVRMNASNANIIVEGDVGLVSVAPLTLKSVTVEAALSLLDGTIQRWPNGAVKLDLSRVSAGGGSALPVYKVTARMEGERNGQSQLRSSVIALDRALDDDIKAEDVLTAIDTALKLYGDEFPEPQIRYHRETKLLIARAHPQQLQVIHELVRELWDARKRGDAAASESTNAQKLASEVADLRNELKQAHAQVESLRTEAQQFQMKIQMLHDELESQRAQRDRMEVETQRRIADYMEQIAQLKSKAAGSNP